MKIRNGFVSNSSSCSFVLGKYYMTDEQIEQFNDFIDFLKSYREHGDSELNFNPEFVKYVNYNICFDEGGIPVEVGNYFLGEIDQSITEMIENFLTDIGVDEEHFEMFQ